MVGRKVRDAAPKLIVRDSAPELPFLEADRKSRGCSPGTEPTLAQRRKFVTATNIITAVIKYATLVCLC